MLIQVVCARPVVEARGEGREGAVLGRHDPPLSVEGRWEDRRATVVVRGEVDFATAGILAQQLDEVAAQEPEHLTVDLGRTSFLDAAGLRVIARARRTLTPRCPLTLLADAAGSPGPGGQRPGRGVPHRGTRPVPLSQPAGRQVQVSRIAVLSRFSAPGLIRYVVI